MPYDANLAQRLREILVKQSELLDEKKMFGGVGYLLHGNMACGVYKDDLIIRVGTDQHEATLKGNHYWTRIEADFHGFLSFFSKIIRGFPCHPGPN